MNRLNHYLLLLLAAQLPVLVWVFWPTPPTGAEDAQQPLFTIETNATDRLVINDGETSVVLVNTDRGWRLPEYHDLPVAQNRISRLIDEFPQLPRGFPVADSAGAKRRFKVAEEDFRRRIEYYAGEQLQARAYLGTAPGFRRVHARPDADNSVFSIEFNDFDLPVNGADLLDKNLLRVSAPQVIEGLDYRLSKSQENWVDDAQNAADQSVADALVNGLTGLRVNSAADTATAAILEETPAPPILTVDTADGRFEFHLYEIEDTYYIKRNDIAVYFDLGKFDYDRLNDASSQTLFPVETVSAEAINSE